MDSKTRIFTLFFVLLSAGMFLLAPSADAAKKIGKISSFNGEVIVLSGTAIVKVKGTGHPVCTGDRIQTKDGMAEITFDDGAVMNIRPHTTSMIEEKEEQQGWWAFKAKKVARRITCFVGSSCFKSGSSKTGNTLQTPTAVCGIRGSAACWGHDLVVNYLDLIEGVIDTHGNFTQGPFGNLGNFSGASDIYNDLSEAAKLAEQAANDPDNADLQKQAQAAVLDALKKTLEKLLENSNLPDDVRAELEKQLQEVLDKMKELEAGGIIGDTTTTTTTTTTLFPETTTEEPVSPCIDREPCEPGDLDCIEPVNADGDLYCSIATGGTDCDDTDPSVYPGAPETCGDGIDQNCDLVDSLYQIDWSPGPAAGWSTRCYCDGNRVDCPGWVDDITSGGGGGAIVAP